MLGLDEARKLVRKYLVDDKNYWHSLESEAVLGSLAKHLGEDEKTWALAGLLHDLDWEQTEADPSKHGLRTIEILKEEGVDVPEEVVHAISSHNGEYTGILRGSKLDFAVAAGENVTGLVYAYALMRPEKMEEMKVSSLKKRFKNKQFAAKVSREMIMEIEKIGLDLDTFLSIAIGAIAEIASEVGLA